ncbi:hypothetical protein ABGB16_26010 [Micromonospora sp. B11E3]|uniref:hypothetical protein n=1 Tax=Micromonospora sp. B11E3 TaxID=3153562 RepID=UPI00325E00E0
MAVRRWPEGHICSGCFFKACETYGRCAGCDAERLVPGLDADGSRLCTDCAGLGDFTCQRCGEEGGREESGACGRCVLSDQLARLLDDGTGSMRAELVPFFEHVREMSRPRSGLVWLSKPHVPPILRALARGDVPLTHEGLSKLSPWRSVIYVRDLLMATGILPPVDRFLLLFEQWLPAWLNLIEDIEHRKVLHRFATWHVLRKLRDAATRGPIGSYRNNIARYQLRTAAAFLAYLADRGHSLGECSQADVDYWFVSTVSSRTQVRPFLIWCMDQRQIPRAVLPPTGKPARAPLGQQQRLALIRRVLTDEQILDADRVLALLVLLFAQPLNRIACLSIDDVIRDGDQVLLRLGDPPTPVPSPFAEILIRYIANRSNLTTATNPNTRLLFPGRRAGQPMHTTSLRHRLRALDIPNMDGRTAAIRQLLLQAPAPVVARMLGYQTARAEVPAAAAGATWKRYAGGDHSKVTRSLRL